MAVVAEEPRRERDLQQTLMERTRASLVYLDRDFNFMRMNAAYQLARQPPRAEMLGRNHFELFPDAENEAIFRQVRDTGEPVTFVAKPFEFADQPWRGVTYWDWTLTPVKTAGGEVEGLVFSLVDVTERIRTQMLSDARQRDPRCHHITNRLRRDLANRDAAVGGGGGLRNGRHRHA